MMMRWVASAYASNYESRATLVAVDQAKGQKGKELWRRVKVVVARVMGRMNRMNHCRACLLVIV